MTKKRCNLKKLEKATEDYMVAWFAGADAEEQGASVSVKRRLAAIERERLKKMRAAQQGCPEDVVVAELLKYVDLDELPEARAIRRRARTARKKLR